MTIDSQLAEAGWIVQSRDQMNLGAGLGVAVREFATGIGPVDYALFVNRTLCDVIDAKPGRDDPSGFSDKAKRYIGSVPHGWFGPGCSSTIMPTRRRGRTACSSFIAPRRCGVGLPSR